jgi:hypothetical protein
MNLMNERIAWLARRDGSVVVGYGPFREAESPPSTGVAFYKRSFCEMDELPWQIPQRFEHLNSQEFQERFPNDFPKLEIHWDAVFHGFSGDYERHWPRLD